MVKKSNGFAKRYYTGNGTIKNPGIRSRRSWDKEVFIVQVKEDKKLEHKLSSWLYLLFFL